MHHLVSTLLSIVSQINLSRHKWQAGVKKIENVNHPIYHLGIRFVARTNKGRTVFYSSSFASADDMFCLSETDENKTQSLYITIKSVADNKTSVTLDFYIPAKPFARLYFFFTKKKIEKNLQQSLINMQQLLSENFV